MKRIGFGLVWAFGFLILAQASWATPAYVTDSYKITLRTGPSVENKILALLTSGQAVEVLETEGDWSYVRLSEGDENAKEGWLLSRYLMTRIPWEMQAKSLKDQTAVLQEKLSGIESKWNQTVQEDREGKAKLEQYMGALQDLKKRYETLKSGAETYLSLKETHEAVQASLEKAREEIDHLREENRELRSSQRNRWMGTGALILLCGLLIGVMVGRQNRRRRSLYE